VYGGVAGVVVAGICLTNLEISQLYKA